MLNIPEEIGEEALKGEKRSEEKRKERTLWKCAEKKVNIENYQVAKRKGKEEEEENFEKI